jgi:hypothetical protein
VTITRSPGHGDAGVGDRWRLLVVGDDDAVTAGRLGGVQGAVGAGDQLIGDQHCGTPS